MSGNDGFFESRDWLDLRYRVLDKHKGACQCCGQRGTPSNPIQVDHVKPRSKFPHLALVEDNLQVLCKQCNLGKGNKSQTDWRVVPSGVLEIQNSMDPAIRFRLQQLSWLSLNGDGKQIRASALKEYRTLWREAQKSMVKKA